MHGAIKNEIGNKYGRLTVLSYNGSNNDKKAIWECRCDCGNKIIVSGKNLRAGNTVSCGCYKQESRTIHGKYNHPCYKTWIDMMKRCYNKNSKHYKDYGGRGIEVCENWKRANEFLKDMLIDYETHKSLHNTTQLDRINNNKGYCKDNCRWVTAMENANNTRRIREFEATSPNGIVYHASGQSSFAREHSLNVSEINKCLKKKQKLHRKWSFKYKEE